MPSARGNFFHISGIRVKVDISLEKMNRVTSITFPNGKPIDLNKKYTIGATSFISSGKDGITHFKNVKKLNDFDKKVIPSKIFLKFTDLSKYFLNRREYKLFKSKSPNVTNG